MNDIEIMEQYIAYEPFFGKWYIRRFIEENESGKMFEISQIDSDAETLVTLRIVDISFTETELQSLRSAGYTEQEIQQKLRQRLDKTINEIKLKEYEEQQVVERKDGSGWLIFLKTELSTVSNFEKSKEKESQSVTSVDAADPKNNKKKKWAKTQKNSTTLDSQNISDRVDATPKKWILWFHFAALFAAGYAIYLIPYHSDYRYYYYSYYYEMAEEVGLYVWLLSIMCFLPSIIYGILYFRQEINVSGIGSKFVTRYKTVLSLTLFEMLIACFGMPFASMENLCFFYMVLIAVNIICCLPLNIYGYVCYFHGKKTLKQRKCMFWIDKMGLIFLIIDFLALASVCVRWDI